MSTLDGSNCGLAYDLICTNVCQGQGFTSCANDHHKSAHRLFYKLPSPSSTGIYICGVVGHALCAVYSCEDIGHNPCGLFGATVQHHINVGGLASIGGTHSLVSKEIPAVIQHELSHNFGAPDHYNNPNTSGVICIMNKTDYKDTWCSSCKSTIWTNKY